MTVQSQSPANLRRRVACHWRRALFAAWSLVAVPAAAANLSGSYIGRNDQFVIFLELAQTEGGQFAGRLRQTSLDAKGALQVVDAPLSGSANGDQFVGKLEPSWIAGGGGAISS